MSKKKLPKFEMLLLAIFFVSFSVWAIAKCNRTKQMLNPGLPSVPTDSVPSPNAASLPTIVNTNDLPPIKVDSIANPIKKTSPDKKIKQVVIDRAILYVTIDGLKLRNGPSLDSMTIVRLPLFEKVYFLDEVTDFKQKINLGTIETDEPWVKIKTKKGRSGWVYGAGVNYYKKKQPGVL